MIDGVVKVEEIQLPRILLRMLIDGEGSGASLTMFEMEVAPGGAMPIPHYHVAFDETVHCVAGRLRMMRDGQTVVWAPARRCLCRAGWCTRSRTRLRRRRRCWW